MASRRSVDIIDVFQHYYSKQPIEVLIIFPFIIFLFQVSIMVEVVQEISFLHQKTIHLQEVLNIAIQIIIFHQLCHKLFDSCIGLNKEHFFFWKV